MKMANINAPANGSFLTKPNRLDEQGTFAGMARSPGAFCATTGPWERNMNSIIYLVGLIVVVLAILSFVGIR